MTLAQLFCTLQETLTVQLDERLRQWAPRPGRAEMDVYEVRDTQLHQHHSKKDRHVGALSMRAAVQQTQYTSMIAEAERALKDHRKAQQVCVRLCLCACAPVRLCACARACGRACGRACVRVCVDVWMCAYAGVRVRVRA